MGKRSTQSPEYIKKNHFFGITEFNSINQIIQYYMLN